MHEKWWIIDVDLDSRYVAVADPCIPPRPALAQPDNGDSATPWYQCVEHTHLPEKDGRLGAHVRASTFVEAVLKTMQMLQAAGRTSG